MSTPGSAFSLAQLQASVWARDGGRVHAVIDGSLVPGLPARLQEADTMGWDCLQRGALSPEGAAQAAYIVELVRESPFTTWLLTEAAQSFAGWGVLALSTRPLLAMREWSRDLAEVRLPDGRRRPWRWWDHGLLDTLLPTLQPGQVDAFFAHDVQVVAIQAERWVWWQRLAGVVDRQSRDVLRPAAT